VLEGGNSCHERLAFLINQTDNSFFSTTIKTRPTHCIRCNKLNFLIKFQKLVIKLQFESLKLLAGVTKLIKLLSEGTKLI